MTEFSYVVTEDEGLHARPAGILVKKALEYTSDVQVCLGERKADLKRIFAVMGLCAKKGDTVRILANGDDEEQAAHELQHLMQANL